MKKHWLLAGTLAAASLMMASATFAEGTDGFTSVMGIYNRVGIKSQLYDPSKNGYSQDKYPLILFLHGEDAAGTDNEAQLTEDVGASFWADKVRQDVYPSYVLAPQCKDDDWTDDTEQLKQLLEDVIRSNKVDTDRIYLVGLSSGATEVWKLLLDYPDEFAGAIPVCGKVPEEYYNQEGAFDALVNMPIWIFHAADDDVVPEAEAQKAVQAIKDAGGQAVIYDKFTPGSTAPAHAVWEPAFLGAGTGYNWLMQQSREKTDNNTISPIYTYSSEKITDELTRVNDYWLGNIWVIDDGTEALIIDTGMGGFGADGQKDDVQTESKDNIYSLYGYIRNNVLKDPEEYITLALTHNHGDHILGIPSLYNSGKLQKIYLNEKDVDGLKSALQGFGIDPGDLIETVSDGDTITAGRTSLDVIDTPAHTDGSICLAWDDQKSVFTGDAIGSGYLWLGWTYADRIIPSAKHLIEEMDKRGIDTIYSGHYENYETFHKDYAENILSCAEGIVNETLPYHIYTRRVGAVATVDNASIYFDLDMIHSPEENTAEAVTEETTENTAP